MNQSEENNFRFVPLEERIVLDAALFFDIGSVAFFDETADISLDDADHGIETEQLFDQDTLDQESAAFLFDADDGASDSEADAEEGYEDFVIHNSPIDINVSEGQTDTVFDLSEIHPAGDLMTQMGLLNFEVSEQDNPGLVSVQVDDTCLTLEYAEGESGEANLTVRGTYFDGTVYDTPFHIQVGSSAEGEFTYDSSKDNINPWLPASYDNMALDGEGESFASDSLHLNQNQDADSASSEGELMINEISGFFGKPSFEEGNWVSSEVVEK